MPLKIFPPREGSRCHRVRGTLGGQRVYRTADAPGKAAAQALVRQLEQQFKRGELKADAGPTWAEVALAYEKAGGEGRFLAKITKHFGPDKLASEIDQGAVDAAALELYPAHSPAYRNRAVYTPIAAVLHHHDPDHGLRLRRPKMPKGRTVWLEPEQVFKLVDVAAPNKRLAAAILYLVYTGSRIGEALALDWSPTAEFRVLLDQAFAWVPDTKTGNPRGVHLPPIVVAALSGIREKAGSVFGYRNRWHFYEDLDPALDAAGIALPPKLKAHVFRHTYGTWMRRAGKTAFDLVDAGVWRDIRSAMRYQHVIASEAAKGADLLPTPTLAEVPDDEAESA